MALNFELLQPANLGANFMAGQKEAQDLQTGKLAQQEAQLKLDDYKQKQAGLDQFMTEAKNRGQNGTPEEMTASFYKYALSQRDPTLINHAMTLIATANRQKRVSEILGGGAGTPSAQTSVPTTRPVAPAGTLGSGTFDLNDPSVSTGALGSGTFNPNAPSVLTTPTNALAPAMAAPSNALAPAAATPYKPVMPRNALAPVAPTAAPAVSTADAELENTYRKIDQLHAIGEHELAKSLEQRAKDRMPPTAVQEFQFAKSQGYTGSFDQFKTLHAPRTTVNVPVNVSTEKKYGEKFAGNVADEDTAMLKAARDAPDVAANSDRILDLVNSGNVITGTGANVRLQIAKALNLAGGTDTEKIRNTEVLVSSLARTTMGAIKSSNLGAGQGFTNSDRDFLEKAEAGQINYDAGSLARLARLSRSAAEKSAEVWNKRVLSIPKSSLEGTGISIDPIVISKRQGAAAATASKAPEGVDQSLWNNMTPQERKLWQK